VRAPARVCVTALRKVTPSSVAPEVFRHSLFIPDLFIRLEVVMSLTVKTVCWDVTRVDTLWMKPACSVHLPNYTMSHSRKQSSLFLLVSNGIRTRNKHSFCVPQ
jgi:hypothetical protein